MTELHVEADRMPAVARGEGAWSAGELAHLAACGDCRAEWDMVRVASGLGARVAVGLDGGRVARGVIARLAAERGSAARFRRKARRWLVGLAAAAAILLVGQVTLNRPAAPSSPSSPSSLTVLHELDELTASELESLLESLPPASGATNHPEAASFDELDARSLERLLRSLEG